jgi:hypothetical protein
VIPILALYYDFNRHEHHHSYSHNGDNGDVMAMMSVVRSLFNGLQTVLGIWNASCISTTNTAHCTLSHYTVLSCTVPKVSVGFEKVHGFSAFFFDFPIRKAVF